MILNSSLQGSIYQFESFDACYFVGVQLTGPNSHPPTSYSIPTTATTSHHASPKAHELRSNWSGRKEVAEKANLNELNTSYDQTNHTFTLYTSLPCYLPPSFSPLSLPSFFPSVSHIDIVISHPPSAEISKCFMKWSIFAIIQYINIITFCFNQIPIHCKRCGVNIATIIMQNGATGFRINSFNVFVIELSLTINWFELCNDWIITLWWWWGETHNLSLKTK